MVQSTDTDAIHDAAGAAAGRRVAVAILIAPVLAATLVLAAYAWAHPARLPAGPFTLLTVRYDTGAVVGVLAVLVAALTVPLPAAWERRAGAALERGVTWLGDHAGLVAGGVAVAFAILAVVVYHGHPLSMDEYAAVLQARTFGAGRLVGHWPPELVRVLLLPGFANGFVVASLATGDVFSCYSPGHALLMAPLAALGAPWACNPLLSALSLVIIASISRRMFGAPAAGWAVLLTIASPVFMAYGVSFYSMAAHNLSNLVFAALLLGPRPPAPTRLVAAGLVGGYALALHNPFPHAMFGLPWIAWLATRPGRIRTLLLLGAGYAMTYVPLAWGWDLVERRGISADIATVVAAVSDVRPSAGAAPPPAAAGSPLAGFTDHLRGALGAFRVPDAGLLLTRMIGLAKLVSWDAPGLLALACLGAWSVGRRPPGSLLAAAALATFAGYLFVVFDQGHGWGYRYFHSAWGMLPILASAASMLSPRGDAWLRRRVGFAAVAGLVLLVPLRAAQIEHFVSGHLAQEPAGHAAPTRRFGPRVLVFIRGNAGGYPEDLVQNDPFLATGPLRLRGGDLASEAATAGVIATGLDAEPRLVACDERGSVWVLVARGRLRRPLMP